MERRGGKERRLDEAKVSIGSFVKKETGGLEDFEARSLGDSSRDGDYEPTSQRRFDDGKVARPGEEVVSRLMRPSLGLDSRASCSALCRRVAREVG